MRQLPIRPAQHGKPIIFQIGEGPLLLDSVCDDVAACAGASVSGRRPLLGGASDNSVARCLARLERLERRGVQYGVVTLPFYGWPGRVSDSVSFFAQVAARSPLPIVAYNLPKAVGWQMPVEAIEELFAIPNLICVKDTHGDIAKMEAVAASPKRPHHFSYLPGNSLFASRLYRAGADGVVSTPANLFPAIFVDQWRRHREQRLDEAASIDRDLMPLIVDLLGLLPTGAASIKGLLEVRGVCRRHVMPPWPEASEVDLRVMREALVKVDAAIAASGSA